MATKFKPGDRVKWKVGKGETTGEVTQKITKSTEIEGKQVNASKHKPRYLIKNDHTNHLSAHRAKSLSLVPEDSKLQPKQQEVLEEFNSAVNMDAGEIKQWLKTEASNSVGQKNQQGKKFLNIIMFADQQLRDFFKSYLVFEAN